MSRMTVLYHIDAPASEIDERAQSLAVEQSVEMPLAAIREERILREVVGRVESVEPAEGGGFLVRIGLALGTLGNDLNQLLNMLFGNSSILDRVKLIDAELPPDLVKIYPGPRFGIEGLRERLQAHGRPLTASAIKPLGLPHRAGEAIQDEPLAEFPVGKLLGHHLHHEPIRNQLPFRHILSHFVAQSGASVDCPTKQLTRREMWNGEAFLQVFGQCSFARSRRSQ